MAGLQPILPAVNMAFFGLAGASLRLVSSCPPQLGGSDQQL